MFDIYLWESRSQSSITESKLYGLDVVYKTCITSMYIVHDLEYIKSRWVMHTYMINVCVHLVTGNKTH